MSSFRRKSHVQVMKMFWSCLARGKFVRGGPGLLKSLMASTLLSDMWEYAQMANLRFAAGVSGGWARLPHFEDAKPSLGRPYNDITYDYESNKFRASSAFAWKHRASHSCPSLSAPPTERVIYWAPPWWCKLAKYYCSHLGECSERGCVHLHFTSTSK